MTSNVKLVSTTLQSDFLKLRIDLCDNKDYDNILKIALECYKIQGIHTECTVPLVLGTIHYNSPILLKKFREIDKESQNYPLNKLILHVALKNIQSSEIREYLFSQANKEELSALLCYSQNGGKSTIENSLLHIAIEKEDDDLIDRLLEKGVDLEIKNEMDKTPMDLAKEKENAKLVERLKKTLKIE